MTEIEKMERYIDRSRLDKVPKETELAYDLNVSEIKALLALAENGEGLDAICIAFEYGRAKGYRMAKAEGKA